MLIRKVKYTTFVKAIRQARLTSQRIRDNTCSPYECIRLRYAYYLSGDKQSGYIVADGELKILFSTVKGRGADLVIDAIKHGVTRLNCYDGYLSQWYASLGFIEIRREKDWYNDAAPEIIYMSIE